MSQTAKRKRLQDPQEQFYNTESRQRGLAPLDQFYTEGRQSQNQFSQANTFFEINSRQMDQLVSNMQQSTVFQPIIITQSAVIVNHD
jgi:hypothetical protein